MKAKVGNVPREIFSTDPVRLMKSAMLVEAGQIELSLCDLAVSIWPSKTWDEPKEAGRKRDDTPHAWMPPARISPADLTRMDLTRMDCAAEPIRL